MATRAQAISRQPAVRSQACPSYLPPHQIAGDTARECCKWPQCVALLSIKRLSAINFHAFGRQFA